MSKNITVLNSGHITYLKYDEVRHQKEDGVTLYIYNGYIVLCVQDLEEETDD